MNTSQYIIGALDLRNHPIKRTTLKNRKDYYITLSYLVYNTIGNIIGEENKNSDYCTPKNNLGVQSLNTIDWMNKLKTSIYSRLRLYEKHLKIDDIESEFVNGIYNEEVQQVILTFLTCPRKWRQRLYLICDSALILLQHDMVNHAARIIKQNLSQSQKAVIDSLVNSLLGSKSLEDRFYFIENLVNQYRINNKFINTKPKKIIVTANISAGKSTLINALIGKSLTKTSQEVCTANICYIFNKPFEDNIVYLSTINETSDATYRELHNYNWDGEIYISSFFESIIEITNSLCIIDTPGVNAALYREHSKITHNALMSLEYEKLLYVISPTNLGTDAEIKHLTWIAENITNSKVIFVLNKIDNLWSDSDNIRESIDKLRNDLTNIGFENPIICPISAYFGLLLKMKSTNQNMTEEEYDELVLLSKRFNKPKFDLTSYYKGIEYYNTDSEELKLYKKSGLYGLEKYIYGGIS